MTSPRLAVLAAAVITSGALGGSLGLAASPSPTPSSSPTASPSASSTPTPTSALDRISSQVRAAMRGSTAGKVHYKITIAGVGDVARQAQQASAPASNEKLFTSIALLEQVGPDFRYATQVYGTTAPIAGTLHGDLILVGSGDPTLTHRDLGKLARQLRATGLSRVTGQLVVDDSRYSHATRAPGWKHDFLPDESGAIDAFSVDNDNWRSSQSFLADPTPANAGLWRDALKAAGIHVAGPTHIGVAPPDRYSLVTHRSRPLSKIVQMTLRESINYYAEMMMREIGYQVTGHGTRSSGVAAVQRFARGYRLPVGRVEDGSGLSYANRETPGTYIEWLAKLTTLPPAYRVVYAGLPASCERGGTLEYRMCGRHMKGMVHAKTGTLDHISSLSGYTETSTGRFVTFSFLLSRVKSITTANNHIDAALKAVVRSAA
ncbi:MAG TPA: D-alanyl-D-alanine carboxypeptidase [Mycobacteriales bacterium]|nr:D-alanyl-D-alanine carboxypeptidase [Mycobacteriales bacterium]